MRALALAVALVCLAAPRAARADVGLGLFVGEPFGVDLKLDLQRRSALDIVIGTSSYRAGRAGYGHLTYLVTPVVGHGRSVLVPLRLGIGAAIYDDGGSFGDGINVAVRAPIEVGFVFRSAPIELYLELAVKLTFVDANRNDPTADLDGGGGFRIYF